MEQVKAFMRAADADRMDEFFMRAVASRAAMQDDRGWRKFAREHQAKAASRKPRRTMTREDAERLRTLLGGKKSG